MHDDVEMYSFNSHMLYLFMNINTMNSEQSFSNIFQGNQTHHCSFILANRKPNALNTVDPTHALPTSSVHEAVVVVLLFSVHSEPKT